MEEALSFKKNGQKHKPGILTYPSLGVVVQNVKGIEAKIRRFESRRKNVL